MPKFMGIHTLPPGGFTAEQVRQLAQAAQQDPVVKGYRSFCSLAAGKAVCILGAPDKESVAALFRGWECRPTASPPWNWRANAASCSKPEFDPIRQPGPAA